MKVKDTSEYEYALKGYHSVDKVTLMFLAEISDSLTRMEQQRLAEFEFYKSAVKMMKRWDADGLPAERNV